MAETVGDPPFLRQLADWAAAPGLRMPGAVLDEARLALLDTLACLYAGGDQPQTRRTLAAMRAAGADGAVRTIAGDGLSASAAALVNGVAAHALDYDDYEVPGSTHPSAPILGALLALAEIGEQPMNTLLDAWVVGYEAICRFGEALGYGHYMAGWHSTSTIGALGATAAGARFRGLPPAVFTSAMSLATSMAAGLKVQQLIERISIRAPRGAFLVSGKEVAVFVELERHDVAQAARELFDLAVWGEAQEAATPLAG